MRLNRISELKVMTIWIARELPLFNFERLNMHTPESDIRIKSYDLSNFSRASVVHFRASRYIMCLNLTSVWKVMTIWISRELHCSILSVSICDAPKSDIRVKSHDHLNFSRASVVQFRASRYVMCLNPTSELKVMTFWISRELPLKLNLPVKSYDLLNRTSLWKVMTNWNSRDLPLFNVERVDILSAWIWPQCEKLWPFEFLENFHCSISSVSICDAPESDIRVKSDDHFNFSRASIVQFRASRYVMRLNQTSKWKVMTIWIARELSLFNLERLYMWCT